jgi:hypothetical protein
MPLQQQLGLVSPSTVLATLPVLQSAKIDMVNPAAMAPDPGAAAHGIAVGMQTSQAAATQGPAGQIFSALTSLMTKKMDPEAQARQKLLDAQVKRMELESSPEVMGLERQKRQFELMNLQDEMEGRKAGREMMQNEFGLKKDQVQAAREAQANELALKQQDLALRSRNAQSQEERAAIEKEQAQLDLDLKKLEVGNAKKIPDLINPATPSGKIPELGASTLEDLIRKKTLLDRAAKYDPRAAAQAAIIDSQIAQLANQKKVNQEQHKEIFKEELQAHQKNRVNYDTALAKLANLEKLNESGSTGFENRFIPGVIEGDTERQFNAAAIEYAKSLRKSGEGAMSDKDVELLMKSAPSVGNNKETNKAIIDRIRAELLQAKAKQTFIDQAVRSGSSPTKAAEDFDMQVGQAPTQTTPKPSASQTGPVTSMEGRTIKLKDGTEAVMINGKWVAK